MEKSLLDTILSYDPESGILTWKERPIEHFKSSVGWKNFNKQFSGKECGSVTTYKGKKYKTTSIMGRTLFLHRIAWTMATGEVLGRSDEIDHVDGCGTNNAISNLRKATRVQNMRNQKIRDDNSSGYPGVHWCKRQCKFIARIGVGGKRKTLGSFVTIDDAIKAKKKAEKELEYHENHGEDRPL